MKTIHDQLVIKKRDFNFITSYLKQPATRNSFNRLNVMELEEEFKKAKIVSNEDFPEDVIGLNSTAIIKDLKTNRVLSITVVMPDKADIRQNKVSVLAPIGTALLGFRKENVVSWQVPSGEKKFLIMEVYNSASLQ